MTEQSRSGVEAAETGASDGVRVDIYDVIFIVGATLFLFGVSAWISPFAGIALGGVLLMILAVLLVVIRSERSEG